MQRHDLLERQEQFAQLDAAFERARATEGQIVLVSGEAGIGKTSLVERFVAGHEGPARVLRGYCDPLLTPSALGPVYDIGRLLSDSENWHDDPEEGSPRLFARLLASFRRSAVPLILVIEDIHWADDATLDLIKFLSRRLSGVPALLVATFRDDELEHLDALRILLGNLVGSDAAVRRLTLDRLSRDAVAAMARGRVADTDALYRQTSGNPFFVSEVLADPSNDVPITVRDAVLGRAARLGAEARAVLDVAAVIGARIEYALLEHYGRDLSAGLSDCFGLGLLLETGKGVAFRHELARNAVLEAIDPLRRRGLYREVLACAVKAGFAEDGRLAQLAHYAEGAASADDVVAFGTAAGRAAARLGAHREAAAHFRSVLRFSDRATPRDRAALFAQLAHESALVDQLPGAIEAYRASAALWSELGDRLRHGDTLAALAWPLVRNGENRAAEEAVEAAIALLEPLGATPELANAYRSQAHLRMLDRDRGRAVAIGKKAAAMASHLGDDAILASSEMVVGAAMLVADDPDGRLHLDRSLDIARAAGLEEVVALVHVNIGSSYGEQYHFAKAEAELQRGKAHSRKHDLDHSGHYMSAWLALTHMFQGRWTEAADLAKSLIAQQDLSAISRIMALVALGRVRVRRGDRGGSEVLDEALRLAERTRTLQRMAPVRAARAERAWFAGELATVTAEAGAALDLALERLHAWHTGEFLFWQAKAGERVTPPDWVATPYALQLSGNWQEAADAWRARSCPYERARALAEGDEAAQCRALEIFDDLGAAPAAAALRRDMRAAGVGHVPRGRRASTRRNPFGLTDREMTILGHLARGSTNREIATELFISAKTVDHHVSAILGKLGTRTRVGAARIALDEGLYTKDGERIAPKWGRATDAERPPAVRD